MRFRIDPAIALLTSLIAVGIAVLVLGYSISPRSQFLAAIGGAAIVVGLLVLAAMIPRRANAAELHEVALRMALGVCRSAITSHGAVVYADPKTRPEDGGNPAFRAHFRRLTWRLRRWNRQVRQVNEARSQLEERINNEVKRPELAGDIYVPRVIARGILAVVGSRAMDRQLSVPPVTDPGADDTIWPRIVFPDRPPDEGMHLLGDPEWAIQMTGVTYEELIEVARQRAEPVNLMLLQALGWPEAQALQTAWVELYSLNQDGLLAIVERLEHRRRRFTRRRRCPVCRDDFG